uniref:MADF domain-containing protein n=1 Tax=Glossina austeni TaxID=7395 RepID=A0A1A9V4F8_GLOAU
MREKISIKFLIHLVGERPALWDKTSDMYKDRSLKETSWREICAFINENYERMPSTVKEEFTKMVIKKWTHIRDSWVKSMKNGYDEQTLRPAKPYIYHDEMQFMNKVLQYRRRRYDLSAKLDDVIFNQANMENEKSNRLTIAKDTNNNNNDDDEDDIKQIKKDNSDSNDNNNGEFVDVNESKVTIEINSDLDDDDNWQMDNTIPPSSPKSAMLDLKKETITRVELSQPVMRKSEMSIEKLEDKPRRNRMNSQSQNSSLAVIQDNINCLYENRHWNFFKGILPSVNNLNDDQTLEFQAGVISLLQKIRNSQTKSFKSKKRKISNDSDCEWPLHNVDMTRNYSTRSSRRDPLRGKEVEINDFENEFDDEDYS